MRISRWLCLVLVSCVAGSAPAQVVPPPGYGGGYYPGRVGGAYHGAADVMRAGSEGWIQQEKARIEREKFNQEKLTTRKKTLDELNYEKSRTATYVEEKARVNMLTFLRVKDKPTPGEVTSGTAFNIMLPYLARVAQSGTVGPPVPIEPDMLNHINLRAPGKSGLPLLGKGPENISWPIAIAGPQTKKMTSYLDTAMVSVIKGTLTLDDYDKVRAQWKVLRADLDEKFDRERINMSMFVEASTFLKGLEKEIGLLRDPMAKRTLTGGARPTGATVAELVSNMQKNGLEFAAVSPGDEPIYYALHSAMAAYGAAVETPDAISLRATIVDPAFAPEPWNPKKK